MINLYLSELADARAELLRVYNRVVDANAQPATGAWSARQVMHHLYLSESSIRRIFKSWERIAEPCEPYSDSALELERDGLSVFVANRETKVEAPERMQPLDLSNDTDVLLELSASRDLLIDVSTSVIDQVKRSVTFVHPLRGKLSLYGWLWFVACHERRHTEQIRVLLTSQTDGKA